MIYIQMVIGYDLSTYNIFIINSSLKIDSYCHWYEWSEIYLDIFFFK